MYVEVCQGDVLIAEIEGVEVLLNSSKRVMMVVQDNGEMEDLIEGQEALGVVSADLEATEEALGDQVVETEPLHEEVASTPVKEIFEEMGRAKHAKEEKWDLALGIIGVALAVANHQDVTAAQTFVER